MLNRLLTYSGLAICITLLACANQPTSEACSSGIVCPAPLQCAAVQAVCISNNCGNGVVDPGEQCDDGNIMDGDGCSHTCQKEVCGNGIIDPGELCDDGNTVNGTCTNGGTCNQQSDCPGANNTCIPDKCSNDCKSLQVCGNGIVDFDEVCDDGNTFNGTCPNGTPCNADADCSGIGSGWCAVDGCRKDCESNETCGNGIVDLNEVCDNGSANAVGATCEPGCLSGSGCGNGVIDPGETCDDGNLVDTDDCPSGSDLPLAERCQIARCGDGIIDSSGSDTKLHEQCDPGSAGETSTCNSNCTTAACGDGIVNPLFMPDGTHGEQCDNGSGGVNNDNADCTSVCLVNVCGDDHRDTLGPLHFEQCDDGNTINGDGCEANCTNPTCGNAIVDPPGEQCDLGSGNNGSASSCPSCQIAICGDGLVETGVEQCDLGAGNNGSNSACPSCVNARCGDGLIETGIETCDDGSNNGKLHDPCDSQCKTVACGNGIVEAGEECDTGSAGNNPTCNSNCTLAVCGDHFINGSAGETCDDGSNNGKLGDPCDSECKAVSCGNDIVEAGEQCDTGVGSSATCNANCTKPVCGDGITNPFYEPDGVHGEQCDNGQANAASFECPYNTSCTYCNTTCQNANGTVPTCGDDIINGPETCDNGPSGNNQGFECPYPSMSPCLLCNACVVSVEPAQFCGDGIVQSAHEECDPLLTPATCNSDCKKFCDDGISDNGESGIDCGGTSTCGSCPDGQACTVPGDCTSTFCVGDLCVDICHNGVQDMSDHETDIDCGGSCVGCPDGKGCGSNADCLHDDCGSGSAGPMICGT